MESHVIAPKLLLKRFQNESGKFYYYDVKKDFIGTNGQARSMNAITDYYPEEVETVLNRFIETPFSSLLKNIDRINYDSTFQFPDHANELIRNFMITSLARNPNTHREVCKNSVYMQLCSQREQHGLAMMAAMRAAEELRCFRPYFSTLTINKSNVPLVLPINCLYQFDIEGIDSWHIPVDPWKAITIIEDKGSSLLIKNNKIRLLVIPDDKQAYRINSFAFRQQYMRGEGWVISPRKETLEKLKLDKDI